REPGQVQVSGAGRVLRAAAHLDRQDPEVSAPRKGVAGSRKDDRLMTPLWRKAYDAVERPLAAGSGTRIQDRTYINLAPHSGRMQRRMLHEVQHATKRWLHL